MGSKLTVHETNRKVTKKTKKKTILYQRFRNLNLTPEKLAD